MYACINQGRSFCMLIRSSSCNDSDVQDRNFVVHGLTILRLNRERKERIRWSRDLGILDCQSGAVN